MKLTDLNTLTQKDYSEYISMALEQDVRMNSFKEKFKNSGTALKPFKVVPNSCWALCYPIELALPFNPFDLTDTTFSSKNVFVLPGTFSFATAVLKRAARDNAELAKKIAELLDTTEDSLNLNSDTIDSIDERILWHKWGRLSYITHYTQKIYMDPSKNYPQKVGFDPILDDEGEIIGSVGIGWQMYKFESALINISIQLEADKFAPGGPREHEPKSTLERETAEKWENRLIRNPYFESYARVVAFPLTSAADGNIETKVVDAFNKKKNLFDFMYSMKVTKEDIQKIEEAFASKKSDIHTDYIEIQLQIPEEDANDKLVIYKKQNRTTVNLLSSALSKEDSSSHIDPDIFDEAWVSTFSDTDRMSNQNLKKSIYAFKSVSDDLIVKVIKDNINRYENAMNSSSIIESYSDAIGLIGDDLADKIASKIMDGEDTGKDEVAEIISSSIDDENSDTSDDSLSNDLNALLDD